jgi:hypothetical protein
MGSDALVSDQTVRPDLQNANCPSIGSYPRDRHHQHTDLNPWSARAVAGGRVPLRRQHRSPWPQLKIALAAAAAATSTIKGEAVMPPRITRARSREHVANRRFPAGTSDPRATDAVMVTGTHNVVAAVERMLTTLEASKVLRLSTTVVILCWHICLISESMGHHDSEIMDDRSID